MQFMNLWRDPVVSGVLSSGISSVLWPFILDGDKTEGTLPWWLVFWGETGVQNWMFVAAVSIAIGLAVYAFQKWLQSRDRACLSSREWFSLVNQKLNDCTSARIYLRKFDHPDNFREEHKVILMQMMNTIKSRVAAGADIKIISYNDNGDKTGLEWLISELKERTAVDSCIKIVQTQIAANSSSMYLFDDKSIVFNRRAGKSMQYYCESHTGSIHFEFVRDGFDGYWGRV
jgi:hypothetical protein